MSCLERWRYEQSCKALYIDAPKHVTVQKHNMMTEIENIRYSLSLYVVLDIHSSAHGSSLICSFWFFLSDMLMLMYLIASVSLIDSDYKLVSCVVPCPC